MPNLWQREVENGLPYLALLPRKLGGDAKQAMQIAEMVPGANFRDDGNVYGASHALKTCCVIAGQPWPEVHQPSDSYRSFKLPDYQQAGVLFLTRRMEQGAMCNDDMGLGKTVQTIAALTQLDPKMAKIILCPASLKLQWKSEIEKWVKTFTSKEPVVHVLWPNSDKRSKVAPPPDAEYFVAYYLDAPLARLHARRSGRLGYALVVDEVHNVRGYGTKRLESVVPVCTFAQARISLTASLLYNNLGGLYPILDFTSPGAWGGYEHFVTRYAGAQRDGYQGALSLHGETNPEELRDRMLDVSIRRVREDVAAELPFDTKYQTIWLDAPSGNLRSLADMTRGSSQRVEYRETHLVRVAMAKVERVVEQVTSDVEAGLPSLVFTWLRAQAEAIATKLPGSLLVLGGENPTMRLEKVNGYVSKCKSLGKIPVVVGTYGALSEGANLQFAKTVNLAALSYTPDEVRQAIGRAARMGQVGTVQVRIFACKNTIDQRYVEIMMEKLKAQFSLDGRKEQAKKELSLALDPVGERDVLREMYERLLKEDSA